MEQSLSRQAKKASKGTEVLPLAESATNALTETVKADIRTDGAILRQPQKEAEVRKEKREKASAKIRKINDPQRVSPSIDRILHTYLGRMTGNISPAALALSYLDWMVHLGISPAKVTELTRFGAMERMRLASYSSKAAIGLEEIDSLGTTIKDSRFSSPYWSIYPFNVWREQFLTLQRWWDEATTDVRGMSKHHEDVVNFCTRQFLNTFSPANNPSFNPDIIKATYEQGGANLVRGAFRFARDVERYMTGLEPLRNEPYAVGENIACTPGKVIFKNRLIELLQYEPSTEKVHPEPILFVPAFVQKYYILDLSPHNSIVKHLVDQGYTVFMISWKNPGPEDRDIGWDDYVNLGVRSSLSVINSLCPGQKIHGMGYCLGGTLLSIAAATFARAKEDFFKSISILASQTDFEEAGELMTFIDDSQVAFIEDILWNQGYLDSSMMAGVFQLLRANDLIWNRILKSYFYGEDEKMSDLNVWSNDPTRMPAHLQSVYMSSLYLRNDFARGRFKIAGRPISLADIRVPMFVMATDLDHISPWRSVFKITSLTETEINFVLCTGGHNSGLVNPPSKGRGYFQTSVHKPGDSYIDAETWRTITPKTPGSWWTKWFEWLGQNADQSWIKPPTMGSAIYPALMNAPGEYILVR